MMTNKEFAEKHLGRRILNRKYGGTYKICGYKPSGAFLLIEPEAVGGCSVLSVAGGQDYIFLAACESYYAAEYSIFHDQYEFIDIPSTNSMPSTSSVGKKIIPPFPHKCFCGSPALILSTLIDCSSPSCSHYKRGFEGQDNKGSALDLLGFGRSN